MLRVKEFSPSQPARQEQQERFFLPLASAAPVRLALTQTANGDDPRMRRRRTTTPARFRCNRRIARRHGFSIPVLAEPALAAEVHDVARTIERSLAGRELDPQCHALACRLAEAMIDLRRVRTAKLPLVAALHADPTNARRPLVELARLDRYERRALSRRDTAIYEFAAAVRDLPCSPAGAQRQPGPVSPHFAPLNAGYLPGDM